MVYTQPAASDYDDWAGEWGNEGWGYKDLLPMLRKVGVPVWGSCACGAVADNTGGIV